MGKRAEAERPIVEANDDKFAVTFGATDGILMRPVVSPAWVESGISLWTWIMIVDRPAISAFDAVYRFARKHRGEDSQALPPAVRRELRAAQGLSILCRQDLHADWYQFFLMTDASLMAGALVAAPATPTQLSMSQGVTR